MKIQRCEKVMRTTPGHVFYCHRPYYKECDHRMPKPKPRPVHTYIRHDYPPILNDPDLGYNPKTKQYEYGNERKDNGSEEVTCRSCEDVFYSAKSKKRKYCSRECYISSRYGK